ncbi:MAG: hypothetical protein K2X87_33100 [Gemmataceae bacterium]|nr:hypothetical protein [Gemmataceae bacterium]
MVGKLAAGVALAVGAAAWLAWPGGVLLRYKVGDGEVVFFERATADGRDYCYRVRVAGKTIGPYFVGPVVGRAPRLKAFLMGPDAVCVYNADRPDDVYCYADLKNDIYYPSPAASGRGDGIDKLLAENYRPNARLTYLVKE